MKHTGWGSIHIWWQVHHVLREKDEMRKHAQQSNLWTVFAEREEWKGNMPFKIYTSLNEVFIQVVCLMQIVVENITTKKKNIKSMKWGWKLVDIVHCWAFLFRIDDFYSWMDLYGIAVYVTIQWNVQLEVLQWKGKLHKKQVRF